MTKQIIATNNAPGAVGPYSQALTFDKLIFTSGQIPLIPGTSDMADNIKDQTKQSLSNVEAILKEAGSSKNSILKTTVFLDDLNNFTDMNAVYEEFFAGCDLPARSCVEISKLPKGAMVEIEVIAVIEG